MTAVKDLGGRTRLSSDRAPSWPFGVRDRLAAELPVRAAGAAGLLVLSERLARRGGGLRARPRLRSQ